MGTAMRAKRNPEAYLEAANVEEQKGRLGKLKIYLGASPGVGKTYQMLSDALSLRAQGLDVVIGVVETHGREEVESLASAFERIPLMTVVKESYSVHALDVGAVIRRSPGLVLIDEAAFRNPDGLRHPKRWQDILELIERGIDVCTTLNVQHLESLNDVASNLIGAPIYETVPDAILEKATFIELIDLPSEDLILRLKQGKIYVPSEISVAVHHFFKKKNLDALRELALKIVEERVSLEVDSDVSKTLSARLMYKQVNLLVCINGQEKMPKLIRAAKRLAVRLKCPWYALFVDTGDKKQFFSAESYLKLAESLGAKTHVIFSNRVANAIEEFVEQYQITQVVIGRPQERFWRPISIERQLKNHLSDIGFYDIDLNDTPQDKDWKQYLYRHRYMLFAVSILVSGMWGLDKLHAQLSPWMMAASVGFFAVFLSRMVQWPQVLMITLLALSAELVLNHVSWHDWQNWGTWALLISVMCVYLVYAKNQLSMASEMQRNNGFLLGFYQEISSLRGVEQILKAAHQFLTTFLRCEIKVYGKRRETFQQVLPQTDTAEQDVKDLAIAQWVFESRQAAGKGTQNLSYSESYFFPLADSHHCLGVMQFYAKEGLNLNPVQQKLLKVGLQQLTNILDVEQQQIEENIRDIHDVKTRLGDELLKRFSKQLSEPISDLLENLPPEWQNKSYGKTLERLKNHLKIIACFADEHDIKQKSFQHIPEILQEVLLHTPEWENRPVQWHVAEDLPEVEVHLELLKAVFLGLLDNILMHADSQKGIEVGMHVKDEYLCVSIADFGPGFSQHELSKIFETFYQVSKHEPPNGMGLGLALCERIITWHGGKIWAENRKPHGAIFNFTLPLPEKKR